MFPTRRIITSGGDKFRDEYSLAFDGSDEVLSTGADGTAADATYVFWMKSSTAATNQGVFGHGSNSKGALHLNLGDKPLWQRAGDNYKYFVANSEQDDGQWHHWVIVNDHSDISACLLYIDGVSQAEDEAPTDSGSVTAYGNLMIGGDKASGGRYAICSISDFAWYDTLLSSSQIQTLYNGREPYNHREGAISANLQGWWQMGDGTERGQGTTIYDMSTNANDGTMTNMEAGDFKGDTP